jgi:hypothetical protein
MDLNTIKNQLDTTESQLSQYGANLPSEIETQIQGAYTPLLERSLGVTKDLMSDYLGRAMETTSMGPGMQGTTAYDLSPSQRMGVIGRELGTMGGQLNSAISYSDYLGGQMNDLYSKAVQAAQLGQQNLADQYARQFQQYQLAWQEAESAKDRAMRQKEIDAQYSGAGNLVDSDGDGIPDAYDQYPNDPMNGQVEDIEVETEPWYKKAVDYATGTDLSKGKVTAGKAAGFATNPIWSTVKTGAGMLGNLIGNTWVPKRADMTLKDKLLNR